MPSKAVVVDTVRAVIDVLSSPDSIHVLMNKIQNWDSLVGAVREVPSFSQTVAQWFTAVGTIGTVVAAVGYPAYKRFKNRPVIEMFFKNDDRCVVKKDSDVEGDRSIDIYIGVRNVGRSVPKYSATYISSYYSISDDEKKILHTMEPMLLKNKKATKIEYIPNGIQYLKVASIKKIASTTRSGTAPAELADAAAQATLSMVDSQEDIYKVNLCGEENVCINTGIFIIPVCFSSVDVKNTIYLKIVWNHENWDTSREKFYVEKIEKKDFDAIGNA